MVPEYRQEGIGFVVSPALDIYLALTLTKADPLILKIIDPSGAQLCEKAIAREDQECLVVGRKS
ncbi:MAG: hypothetical protein ABFS45_22190 [Pseudomonadota bacterium]